MQLKSGFKEILNSEDPPVKVPLFVDNGEIIKIDTRTGVYVERVKNK